MTDQSNQEATVLGILYEHHHYAHRIQEVMEKREMDNWADMEVSYIHNILEQLETNKLVQNNIKAENEGQTPRKV
ncbi:MAG: hypothetical protein HY802_04815 [Methanobacterium sp.]|nr:hypothetical protein [Methanobacterium sp.]